MSDSLFCLTCWFVSINACIFAVLMLPNNAWFDCFLGSLSLYCHMRSIIVATSVQIPFQLASKHQIIHASEKHG